MYVPLASSPTSTFEFVIFPFRNSNFLISPLLQLIKASLWKVAPYCHCLVSMTCFVVKVSHSIKWRSCQTVPPVTRIPRRLLCAWQRLLTLHENLIPLLFCKGVRAFQSFVTFLFVLSFSLFQIYLISLGNVLLKSHLGVLHWTYINYRWYIQIHLRKEFFKRQGYEF